MDNRRHFPVSPQKDVDWVKQVCHVSTKFPRVRAYLRRAENMTTSYAELRKHGRYPYTFAYDFVREAISRTNEAPKSREDASLWIEKIIESGKLGNTTKEQFCTMLAEQYISHAVRVAEADEAKKVNFATLRALDRP